MIRKATIIALQTLLIFTTLLCVAFAALWISGSFKLLRWELVNTEDELIIVAVADGHMVIQWNDFENLAFRDFFADFDLEAFDDFELDKMEDLRQAVKYREAEFELLVSRRRRSFHYAFPPRSPPSSPWGYSNRAGVLGLDLWLPTLLTAMAPACFWIRYFNGPLRRKRRKKRGLCTHCSYDLRGLTEPRCPECSTAFDPSTLPSPPG